MSGTGDGMTDSVANIAGAIADAVRESLQRTLTPQPHVAPGSQNPRPSASPTRQPPTTSNVSIGSLYERVSAVGSVSGISTYHIDGGSRTPQRDVASVLTGQSSSKKRFAAPSMFTGKRSRRNEPHSKAATYTRDILCLPGEFQGPNGTVPIPRGSRRNQSATEDTGLFGKIVFDSDWSPERMREEIASVFAKPFGLHEEDLATGKVFISNELALDHEHFVCHPLHHLSSGLADR